MSKTILIITDKKFEDDVLVKMLDSWGYQISYFFSDRSSFIDYELNPDLIIVDLKKDINSETLKLLNRLDSPTIFLNDVRDEPVVDSNNYSFYLNKPLIDEKLKFAAEMIIYHEKTGNKLLKNHDTYRLLYENAPMAYQSLDKDGNILEVNAKWLEKLGYTRDMVLNRFFGDFLVPESVEKFKINFPKFKLNGEVTGVEFEMVKADNSTIMVSFDGKIGYDQNGNFIQTHCIFKDITAQKKAENALIESERYYKTIFENTGTATIIVEENSTVSLVNTQFENLYGLKKEFIEGKKWTDFVSEKFIPRMRKYHLTRRINPEVVPRNYEFDFVDSSGEIKNIFVTVAIVPGTTKSLVSLQDITYRKTAENALKTSVLEKDTLLREIHHRVKNNLQIISSLLNLQSRYIEDEEALDVFIESQNRVRSMAIIHEKLYKSDKMSKIDFGEYINDLTKSLFYNYLIEQDKIRIITNIENIYFDVDTSIPCGLIVNELITNCVKHAFPNDINGEINIDMSNNQGIYTLNVSDNGVGFPEDIDFKNTESLGLQLVSNLVNQLDGTVELVNKGGTSVVIKFNELVYKNRK